MFGVGHGVCRDGLIMCNAWWGFRVELLAISPNLNPESNPPPSPHPQIVVKEKPRHWYHFLTTTCAIIGGVFTVAGIIDAILHNSFKFAKKMELGKQG
jgi:hypothetical protein